MRRDRTQRVQAEPAAQQEYSLLRSSSARKRPSSSVVMTTRSAFVSRSPIGGSLPANVTVALTSGAFARPSTRPAVASICCAGDAPSSRTNTATAIVGRRSRAMTNLGSHSGAHHIARLGGAWRSRGDLGSGIDLGSGGPTEVPRRLQRSVPAGGGGWLQPTAARGQSLIVSCSAAVSEYSP
jgi:hypothetical protein